MPHYKRPGFFTAHVFNPLLLLAMKMGLSARGSRILVVRGRKSGAWRSMPVNPLSVGGERYLVAPRGNTHWARNIRASGEGQLKLGRRTEAIKVEEVPDDQKVPLLRAYLKNWAAETKTHFGVPNADVPDAELARIAPEHPIFRIKRP